MRSGKSDAGRKKTKAIIAAILMLGNMMSQSLAAQAIENTDDMRENFVNIEETGDPMESSQDGTTTDSTKGDAEESAVTTENNSENSEDIIETDPGESAEPTEEDSEEPTDAADPEVQLPSDLTETVPEESSDSAEPAPEGNIKHTESDSEIEEDSTERIPEDGEDMPEMDSVNEQEPSVIEDPEEAEEAVEIPLDEDSENNSKMQWDVEELSLILQYDDRYPLAELQEGYVPAYLETTEVSSYQVSEGKKSEEKDAAVITIKEGQTAESSELIAAGTGSAMLFLVPEEQMEKALLDRPWELEYSEDSVQLENSEMGDEPIRALKVNITVEPGRLTLMYIAGQSNAEGQCSANTGYEIGRSVACEPGKVYSTYAPGHSTSKKIADIEFSSNCNVDNASDFVPGALTDSVSISGKPLEYEVNTLTQTGRGKTGIDSGLAYEWNRLTDDKVWVVNTAWCGTTIRSWIPGSFNYNRSEAVYDLVQQTYEAEQEAGHYVRGEQLLFWLQGEHDAIRTAEYYTEQFHALYNGMMDRYDLDAMGLIMVRSSVGNYTTPDELKMTGPRIAQYLAGSGNGPDRVFVVSNVNEQWISDQGVETYFAAAYPDGMFSYPIQNSDTLTGLPTTMEEVHNDIHYSQLGHNENGITAANGMYKALFQDSIPDLIFWKNGLGEEISGITLHEGESCTLVPVTMPAYYGKKVSYFAEGDSAFFDASIGQLTGMGAGTEKVTAYSEEGNVQSAFPVTVYDALDLTLIAGEDYTGFYYYDDVWQYLDHGWIQSHYSGIIQQENEWWYVKDGRANFYYTGVARNENGWWRVENGKVNFNYNGIARNENGWWYVRSGKVNFGYTGVARNENGWWRIENGKVNFDYNGIARNENGWWYIQNGKVNFGYTGVARNENGWWRVENGKVNFDYNGIARNENGWWYLRNGKVNFYYTGMARNENGWWRIKNGQVDFLYTGLAQNEHGWWYMKDGKLDWEYTGTVWYQDSFYQVENGKVTS